MSRLDALRALKAAVEAGADTAHHHAAAFPPESEYGYCTWHDSHKASTDGSLDAFIAFKNAVMPEHWWRSNQAIGVFHFSVALDGIWHSMTSASNAIPARAGLLAILAALIAQEEAR